MLKNLKCTFQCFEALSNKMILESVKNRNKKANTTVTQLRVPTVQNCKNVVHVVPGVLVLGVIARDEQVGLSLALK